MTRYPHIATVEQTVETDSASGIPTITTTQWSLKGRYEPAGQRNSIDKSAKFYTPKDVRFDNDGITGHRLFYNGSWINVSNAFNYQSHAEIWLD